MCLLAATVARAEGTASDDAAIRATIEPAIASDSGRGVPRVARVTLDDTGDLTVVFAMRDVADDPQAIGATGLDDLLSVMRAVYRSPDAARIRTATVVGTYAVWGKFGRTRELPLVRATLSQRRAAGLDWCFLRSSDLPVVAEEWWIQEDIRPRVLTLDAAGPRSSSCTAGSLRGSVDSMLLHLTEALHALNAGEVGLARSQFKQFFDIWDNVDDEYLAPSYPDQYATMDRAEEQAEIALLHTHPEDVDGGRAALLTLRSALLDIARHLDGTLTSEGPASN